MNTKVHVEFPGGKKVESLIGGHRVVTDQPVSQGGEDAGPSPFDLFLASLAACSGYYALEFCRARGLSPGEMTLDLTAHFNPEEKRIDKIEMTLKPPSGFPEKFHAAISRAVDLCAVKKHLLNPPGIEVKVFSPKEG
jgi:ribosomal protein S12 methylthiotransferase accessory factor